MTDNAIEVAEKFFTDYAQALLARDSTRLAAAYAVPALIAFPQQSIPVTDQEQTRQFFEQAFGQYEGISEASPAVTVLASTAHSIWADVTWSYDGQPRERFVYQLLLDGADWKVAVLTPLGQDD